MGTQNTNHWYEKMAALEEEHQADFGAGCYQLGAAYSDLDRVAADPKPEVSQIIFGRLVQLMRRKRSLTIEGLAKQADVELAELVEIEDDFGHVPEPRTVYQLAQFFKLAEDSLMQLAGLTKTRDSRLMEAGVRFAARSNPVVELEPEEKKALEDFVAVLDKQD